MAISTLPVVTTLPVEGSPTFRADAATAWSELYNFSTALKDTTIPQMNTDIQTVNQNTLQVSLDASTAETAKDEAISAKDEAVDAKNQAIQAKTIIDSYGITADTASTLTEIQDTVNGFNIRVVDVEKIAMRTKMQTFGIGLQL